MPDINDTNGLQESAGELGSLNAKRIFGRRPYQGCVYFIRAGASVKIGFSTRPLDRLRSLQTSHPDEMEILCTIPGTPQTEKATHRIFKLARIRGEWFRLTPEMRRFIVRHGQNVSPALREKTPVLPAVPSKPKLPPMPEVSRLLKLRRRYGYDTPVGYICSNLAETLPLYHSLEDEPERKVALGNSIRMWTSSLTSLLETA